MARQERLERQSRDLDAVGDGAKADDAEGEEVEHGEACDKVVRRRWAGGEVREHGLRKGRIELHCEAGGQRGVRGGMREERALVVI